MVQSPFPSPSSVIHCDSLSWYKEIQRQMNCVISLPAVQYSDSTSSQNMLNNQKLKLLLPFFWIIHSYSALGTTSIQESKSYTEGILRSVFFPYMYLFLQIFNFLMLPYFSLFHRLVCSQR